MVTFRDLGDISIGTLYKTYDEAFCDYPVNLGFDEAKLQNCFDRRGCEGIHSYGAFEGDKLIGFTYNAVRELDGKRFFCYYVFKPKPFHCFFKPFLLL